VLERGKGPTAAVRAVAQTARQADADLGPFEIEPVGIPRVRRRLDLDRLQEIELEQDGKRFLLRTPTR
jgi:hypothetical protein